MRGCTGRTAEDISRWLVDLRVSEGDWGSIHCQLPGDYACSVPLRLAAHMHLNVIHLKHGDETRIVNAVPWLGRQQGSGF